MLLGGQDNTPRKAPALDLRRSTSLDEGDLRFSQQLSMFNAVEGQARLNKRRTTVENSPHRKPSLAKMKDLSQTRKNMFAGSKFRAATQVISFSVGMQLNINLPQKKGGKDNVVGVLNQQNEDRTKLTYKHLQASLGKALGPEFKRVYTDQLFKKCYAWSKLQTPLVTADLITRKVATKGKKGAAAAATNTIKDGKPIKPPKPSLLMMLEAHAK